MQSENSFGQALKQFVKKNAGVCIGFLVSGFLLWLTLHKSGLEFKQLALSGEQWLYFAAGISTVIVAIWLQSVRSKLLWLKRGEKWSQIHTYKSFLIGNFYLCVLPANLGEGVRAWHFSKKNDTTFVRSLSSVVAEKWLDALGFILLAVILFSAKPFYKHFISYSVAYMAGTILVLGAVYIVMRTNKRIEKTLWAVVLLLRKPGRFFFKLYYYANGQMGNVYRQGFIGQYLLLCAAILALNIMQFFLVMKCAGVEGPVLSLYGAYLIAVSMMILVFIPSAPSNIGVLHYGVYSTLILGSKQYGVEPGAAALQTFALFGIYLHLSFVIPEVVFGAVALVIDRKLMFGKNATYKTEAVITL